MPHFAAILLNSGLEEIMADVAGSGNVRLNKYRIGSASDLLVPIDPDIPNVYPPSDYARTDVVDLVFSGNVGGPGEATINAVKISQNEVRFLLVLPESVGNFTIGNLVLFDDNDIPFIFAALTDATIEKYQTVGTQAGNRVHLNFTLAATNLAQVSELTILASCCDCLPIVPTQHDLPPPGTTPHNAYLVQNHTEYGSPFIAFWHIETNTWFGTGVNHSTRSLGFGTIDGGVDGDRYRRGSIVKDYGTFARRIEDAGRPINSTTPPHWLDFDGGDFGQPIDPTDEEEYDFGDF